MDWITDQLAIGNYLEVQDSALLKQHGFRSVLNLDGTLTPKQAAEFGLSEIASYQLVDGVGNDLRVFRFAIQDLSRLVTAKPPVLVQCHAGRSRSVVVIAGYLMEQRGIKAEEAIEVISAKREVNVTPGLIELLYKVEG